MKIKRSEILSQMLEESKMDISGFRPLLFYMAHAVRRSSILCERDREIFLEIINGATLKDVGEKFDLTRERIRQLYDKSLRKITYAILQFVKEYSELQSLKDEVEKLRKENRFLREYKSLDDSNVKHILLRDCGQHLSYRAINCLNSAEIETVEQLAHYRSSDLLRFRNFGRKSLAEIKEFLKSQLNIDWN